MTPSLDEIFRYLANPVAAQQVIDGSYTPHPGTNNIVIDFLVALKRRYSMKEREEISLIVTETENEEGWRKMKEKTARALGVIGFTHYKTCSEYENLNTVDTFFCNAPFIIKVLPDQWMTITYLQNLKQIRIFIVYKMRYIQLMDPEFNIKNKILGKK